VGDFNIDKMLKPLFLVNEFYTTSQVSREYFTLRWAANEERFFPPLA